MWEGHKPHLRHWYHKPIDYDDNDDDNDDDDADDNDDADDDNWQAVTA